MSNHDEFAIFRRFRNLNMKNLLYLQAEIAHLEEELSEVADRDSLDPECQFHGRDWWSLAQGEDGSNQEQWHKVLQLREKLDIYNDAVLKQARLARLDSPSQYELRFLRTWLARPRMGNFPLLGLDRKTWNKEYEDDLLALRAQLRGDAFSSWFTETLVPIFHRYIGAKFKVCDNICLAYMERSSCLYYQVGIPISRRSKFMLTATNLTGLRSHSSGNIFLRRQVSVDHHLLHLHHGRLSNLHRIRIDPVLYTNGQRQTWICFGAVYPFRHCFGSSDECEESRYFLVYCCVRNMHSLDSFKQVQGFSPRFPFPRNWHG